MKNRSQIAIACFLLMAAGCGQGELKEFAPKDGGFKIAMPGTPKFESLNAGGVSYKNYTVSTRSGAYVVSAAEMPIPKGESDAQVQNRLDGAVQGMVGNTKAQLKDTKKITLQSKFPGREVTADLPDQKGVIHARIYLVGTKLYQTMAIGTKDWALGSETEKFLNSFAIEP